MRTSGVIHSPQIHPPRTTVRNPTILLFPVLPMKNPAPLCHALATLLLLVSPGIREIAGAATFTWTDAAGDHDWQNPENWTISNGTPTNSVPSLADAVGLPKTLNGVSNFPIYLNGHAYAQRIALNSSRAVIGREGDELTVAGNINGGGATIHALVHFTADAQTSGSGWGNSIIYTGGADGDVTITNNGSQNNWLTITNKPWSVSRLVASGKGPTFHVSPDPAMELVLRCGYSDGNGNRTGFNVSADAPLNGTTLRTETNAGSFSLSSPKGTPGTNVAHRFSVQHDSGNLALRFNTDNGMYMTADVEELSVGKNTVLDIGVGARATVKLPMAPDADGFYPDNWHSSLFYLGTKEDGSLAQITSYPVITEDTALDPHSVYRNTMNGTWTLGEDREVRGMLRYTTTGDLDVDLNGHTLTLGSLRINSAQALRFHGDGAVVFKGENICLYTQGSGELRFSVPWAWQRPASVAEDALPSIIIMGAAKPEIIIEGGETIHDYDALLSDSLSSTIGTLVFADDASRTFHGDIIGRPGIRLTGPGTLRFNGQRVYRGSRIQLYDGLMILGNASGPIPALVTNQAVFALADGVTWNGNPNSAIVSSAVYAMEGHTASATSFSPKQAGITFMGGLPGETGTFRLTNTFRPDHDFNIAFKIGAEDESRVEMHVFQPSTSGTVVTMTVSVEDLTDGVRTVHSSEVFPVLTLSSVSRVDPATMPLVLENRSPGTLDLSGATLAYNAETKTFELTGIRSLEYTMFLIR